MEADEILKMLLEKNFMISQDIDYSEEDEPCVDTLEWGFNDSYDLRDNKELHDILLDYVKKNNLNVQRV